jgi:TPR repeat protein
MASLSSHNIGIPLATLLEWYKIRDTFFGENCVSQNIPLALELAAACQHPDARWLSEVCAGKKVTTRKNAKRVFSALGENDARALCFAWFCGDRKDYAPLHRSASLGFAFAQAVLAGRSSGEKMFKFAQMAAAQGERLGVFWLGACLCNGLGFGVDLDKAKENFLLASELGDVGSMIELGHLLDDADPLRWRSWGRAAALGNGWSFACNFSNQVQLFDSGSGKSAVVFAIGQTLRGRVNEEAKTIFNGKYDDSLVGPAKQAIAYYEAQIKATKDAVRAWTLIGLRLNVVKDVRKLIAKLIWDSREEALYKT